MGIVEDKIIKNHYAAEYIFNKYRNTKTVGVYQEDLFQGYQLIYEPIGVIAAFIPTTNPTATAIFKTLLALKTRNGIIISPYPAAKDYTIKVAKIVLDAAVAAGAPKNIIGWVEDGQLQDTIDLMKNSDLILATGEKQTYFSQFKTANSLEKYATIARYCDIEGNSDGDLVDKLIAKVQTLSKQVEIPKSFKDYFVKFKLDASEKSFSDALDKMTQDAFDDQCTPANPRIPLLRRY